MADTREAVYLTPDWQSVSALTGIIAGTGISIQNLTNNQVHVVVSATQPPVDFIGEVIQGFRYPNSVGQVLSGNNEVWLRGDGLVSIQED